MKKLKLRKLALTNFKGIKHFVLDANGEDIKVYGDNGTGKTTAFDGFVWLLFDKDSKNSGKFDIKTLVDGKAVHNLEHVAEAELIIDGKPLHLKKVYKEVWKKKRGATVAKFTGHTTDHFIDGVPSNKTEYKKTVAEIVDEEIFKLLTNPFHFNEHIDKEKRRDILLSIAGDVTDEDVIASNQKLKDLAEMLSGRSIEKHQRAIAAKRKEINEELVRIPVRISEVHRGLPVLDGLDKKQIADDMDNLLDQMEQKQEQMNSIHSGGEISNLKAQISEIELHVSNVRNDHVQQGQQQVFSLKTRLQEEKSNLNIIESKKRDAEYQFNKTEDTIKRSQDELASLRDQWKEIDDEKFTHTEACECPTCGQSLPQEQIDTAREKAEAAFNLEKSNKLGEIKKRGKKGAESVKQLQEENTQYMNEIAKLDELIGDKNAGIQKLEGQIKEAESNVSPLEENEDYKRLIDEKQVIQQRIETLRHSLNESIQAVQREIDALREQQNALQADLNKFSQAEQGQKRIAELEEQEKHLAEEYEELERQQYLTEEFTRTKVSMMNEKISSKFKYARFKLFNEQVNGGLDETCETTYNGVPYSSGLNNAARINVGLDIINTLSEHYGVQAPIFVDNAESITKLIDIDAQVISLIVSEQDKELRVESNSSKESEVA